MKGGRREGAGRKPDPNKRQSVTVRLPPWLVAWLRNQKLGSQSEVIEAALVAQHKLDSGRSGD